MADFKLIFMCLGSISLEYYTSRNINGSYIVLKFYFIMKMNCITEKPIERQQVVSLLIQDKKSKKISNFHLFYCHWNWSRYRYSMKDSSVMRRQSSPLWKPIHRQFSRNSRQWLTWKCRFSAAELVTLTLTYKFETTATSGL